MTSKLPIVLVVATVCLYALVFPNLAKAQSGAVPIRIGLSDGSESRCINGSSDRIWLTLRRVITDKNGGWLKEDKTVALILSAQLNTYQVGKADQPDKPIKFPLMTEAQLQGYSKGQVSVPLEYTLVSGFLLTQDKRTYGQIGVELTLLNKQGKTKWGNALAALSEVAKKLPIPASPYSQAATYLLDFANSAVDKDIAAQNSNDKAKTAALAFNFDPNGKCAGASASGSDFEQTGTVAVLQSSGSAGNLIDINKTNDYCWDAELKPAFILKAAKKDPDKDCKSRDYRPEWQQVTNNYTAFFMNAVASTGQLGADAEEDQKRSISRCTANGIATENCLKVD